MHGRQFSLGHELTLASDRARRKRIAKCYVLVTEGLPKSLWSSVLDVEPGRRNICQLSETQNQPCVSDVGSSVPRFHSPWCIVILARRGGWFLITVLPTGRYTITDNDESDSDDVRGGRLF